jgi:hypothetical protein
MQGRGWRSTGSETGDGVAHGAFVLLRAGIRLTVVACACSLAATSAAARHGQASLPLLAPAPNLNIDSDYPPAVKDRVERA